MHDTVWDVIVVGAGPAGLMAAITCARGSLRVLVLEAKEKIGAKLLISGGGRCNITNLKVSERDYQSGQPRTVRNILRAFPPERTLDFFKELGVSMVLEEGTKFFPKDQSAKTVLNALLQEADRCGVHIEKSRKVKSISYHQNLFQVQGNDFQYNSKTVIMATGGLSYPGTGSDGMGYELAKKFRHKIVSTIPALTPLTTDDPDWKSLSGITLPVTLMLEVNNQEIASSAGPVLFTHRGFSGPAVLDISGAWLRCHAKEKKLRVNFLPEKNEMALRRELIETLKEHPKWSWKRFLALYFPDRLVEVLLCKLDMSPGLQMTHTSKEEREDLLKGLLHFSLQVTGSLGYEKAEVTSGGVDLAEVDSKTLESKRCPGLFFAGEILDVDGRIGGFNFQWAWASGFVTGMTISKKRGSP